MSKGSHTHWGAFEAVVNEGRLVDVRPFSRDPHPSPLIRAIPSAIYAESRIDRPMVRESYYRGDRTAGARRGAEPFVPVSWDEALHLIAGELARIRAEHGNEAIFGGSYGWSSAGRINHARTLLHRFLYRFGGCVDQVTNYSWGTAAVLLPHIVGGIEPVAGPVTSWSSIVKSTRLMVMFGGASTKNSYVTTGGAGAHEFLDWLQRARQSRIDFVSVSPLRDDAPDLLRADWMAIRPGSDTALLLALSHTLIGENLCDRDFLARHTVGFARYAEYLLGTHDGRAKDADWAAALTDIAADRIRGLARRMARERTMITATWSLQRAEHGEQPYWAIINLAAMLGQIGLPGGGFAFGYGSINGMGTPRRSVASPSMEAGRNPLGRSIPVARFVDMLLEPGASIDFNGGRVEYPDIRLVYWCGGNPFHHHQDINRMRRAWARPETIIVHEIWWTATAKHADIVLPATSAFERDDVGASPRDRFIVAMPQLIPPVGQARNDYDIFAALADRLGIRPDFTEGRTIKDWVRHAYEECRRKARGQDVALPPFDRFWQEGHVELPLPRDDFVSFSDFRASPEGARLATPSGKIELFSERIASFGYPDCPGHPVWIEAEEWLGSKLTTQYPLHLISNQPATRLHSQMDDGDVSRAGKTMDRETARLNPADAAARGIATGDVVRLFNDRGACLAGALVTSDVRPGVVQLAVGAWYDPWSPEQERTLEIHGNPNVLTRDVGTSSLGQGPSALSALIQVERWNRPVPPIRAFARPQIAEPG